jgi:hypothetical protein
MVRIEQIKRDVEILTKLLEEDEGKTFNDPNNFALQISTKSYKDQITSLRKMLYDENIKREKEILQFRVIGKNGEFGSFPLNLVGLLTNPFASAIGETSLFYQYGGKHKNKYKKLIDENIDLRLEGITAGSTIFFISAKITPNLYGESIIQHSLENSFQLLNSQTVDDLFDAASLVGKGSIKYFSNLCENLFKNDLEIDLKWHTPTESIVSWDGKKEKQRFLIESLSSFKQLNPDKIIVTGKIITLSLKDKFVISSDEGETYYCRYPNLLTENLKLFHIDEKCKAEISRTSFYSPITNKTKYEYYLENISKV